MQGVYYYRNHRLIKYGGWEGLFGETKTNMENLGKIEINVPGPLYRHFGLDPNKTGFDLPGDFAMRLQRIANEKRQWGQIAKEKRKHSPARHSIATTTKERKAKILLEIRRGGCEPTTTPSEISRSETAGLTVNTPAAATKKKRAPKPKQVVVNIEEQETEVLVRIDRNRPGADDLPPYHS